MATTVGCTLNMYGTNTTTIQNQSFDATSILVIRITNRYQTFQSINGVDTLVADILSQMFKFFFELPVHALAEPESLQSYLSDCVLSSLELDASVVEYLKPNVAAVAIEMVERTGIMSGFEIMVDLGVLKFDLVGEEEVSMAALQLMEMGQEGLMDHEYQFDGVESE